MSRDGSKRKQIISRDSPMMVGEIAPDWSTLLLCVGYQRKSGNLKLYSNKKWQKDDLPL